MLLERRLARAAAVEVRVIAQGLEPSEYAMLHVALFDAFVQLDGAGTCRFVQPSGNHSSAETGSFHVHLSQPGTYEVRQPDVEEARALAATPQRIVVGGGVVARLVLRWER